ncbi:leucine-rich repeat domain-containing protein [Silvanigrella aquatica]|uniref:Uncharacterized protein n=1 Tax=Silvanigrella aquatica TaxID=1915309 RepID=A0A1L4D207_9BACT|nr:leucine-rich repeat domain-containing protein [Silvanigrella aquatica]APJ04245.1 hypothetical protein AXG55_10130 [Silvanigrella aquatica]
MNVFRDMFLLGGVFLTIYYVNKSLNNEEQIAQNNNKDISQYSDQKEKSVEEESTVVSMPVKNKMQTSNANNKMCTYSLEKSEENECVEIVYLVPDVQSNVIEGKFARSQDLSLTSGGVTENHEELNRFILPLDNHYNDDIIKNRFIVNAENSDQKCYEVKFQINSQFINLAQVPNSVPKATHCQFHINDAEGNKVNSFAILLNHTFKYWVNLNNDSLPVQSAKAIQSYMQNSSKEFEEGLIDIPDYDIDLSPFTGFHYIKALKLNGKNLISLHEGIFSGMENLKKLYLMDSQISRVTQGMFSGLGNLEFLTLSHNRITSLPENVFHKLPNLKELFLVENKLTLLPEKLFYGLNSLEILFLSENNFEFIPDEIFRDLVNLEVLGMWLNNINRLPNSMKNLLKIKEIFFYNNPHIDFDFSVFNNLENLDLRSTNLNEFPQNIVKIKNLNKLWIGSNDFKEIPVNIIELKNLEELDLSSSKIINIPKEIFYGLQNLKKLNLSYMRYMNINENIKIGLKELKKLEGLNLNSNDLNHLPEDFFTPFVNLKELKLSSTQLEILPNSILQLKNLEKLNLSNNKFNSLPEGIFSTLTRLKDLNLYNVIFNNKNYKPIKEDTFSNLKDLESIKINGMNLESLYNDKDRSNDVTLFKGLKNLTYINLSDNNLSKIPEELRELNKLKTIILNGNKINEIPSWFAEEFPDLEDLRLTSCSLQEFPKNVLLLNKLKKLELRNNRLTSLPENIKNLQKLDRLELNNNKFSIFPEELLLLKNLTILDLGNNNISILPERVRNLRKLKQFHLFHNQIAALPKSIVQMNNLESFDLGQNKFTAVPLEIKEMEGIKYLSIGNNELYIRD